ncbi:winged helix-turn-helix transcriptional regulator [Caulobacter rhizosphaerae]|jgi:DNA-binding Lrp family transcriptional regulator|uniref:winged helix-turn-helix transcriptional regulator n=1 Tax=Caulobacter rhizosphaerae TaxID=2010972 RepID=UPI0013D1BD3C|nr:hypothetical protein GCM10010983_03930 [Caulobacter rhizosphaerae]
MGQLDDPAPSLWGATWFDDFQKKLEISRNLLTARLKKLVARGILERRPIDEEARRHRGRPRARSSSSHQLRPSAEHTKRDEASIDGAHVPATPLAIGLAYRVATGTSSAEARLFERTI